VRTLVFLIAISCVACAKDEAPTRSPAAPDARAAVVADAAPRAADAAPSDAAVAPDAGATTRPRPRPAPDAAPPPAAPDAGVRAGACRRTKFDTRLVADACAEGGQAAAKAAMKKWLRGAKKQEPKLECKSCHDKLAPEYPLEDDGLEHFQRLGGE
jgi:hypothetical protein